MPRSDAPPAEPGPVAQAMHDKLVDALSPADLLRFFEATGHQPRWLDFPL